MKDEGSSMGDGYLNCEECKKMTTPPVRRAMRCGWVKPEDRMDNAAPVPPGAPRASECPGYLISMPEVYEASRALGWKRDGAIRELYPEGITRIAVDAIDTVDCAISAVERYAIRKARIKDGKK